ncbi:MAG: chloride channel protein [Gammaproteobacteria bacterium]
MLEQSTVFLSITAWKQRLAFWSGAILIGLVIVLMTWLSEWASTSYRTLTNLYPWSSFVIAPLGLGITAWITFRFFPGTERSGIPQVKTALAITQNFEDRTRLISFRIALGKMLLPIMGLLSGASVGFGGPAVHVGASLMASLGKAVRFPPNYMEKGLIMAGSAAGFAAMFSAPLTGIIFAIEEMGRALEEQISSLVLTAIVLSGVTAYAIMGSYIFFDANSLIMPWGRSWLAIPLCGIIGGFFGALFSRIIITISRLIGKTRLSPVLIAILCGCVIAALAYSSEGDSVGTGYQQTLAILNTPDSIDPLFPVYKMLATLATFFSGIPAGIFVPSIATGAGFGANLAHWFPIAPVLVMMLLTITAYFSGMLQSPLTSFVIVMEMTNSNEILIPLMATAFFATGTSKLINPVPLYRSLCDSYKHTEPETKEAVDEN